MATPTPPPLDGAASPNAWHFAAGHGPLPNPVGHTFPIVSHDAQGVWRLIGTGFYISVDGLFVTAKHVIEDVLKWDEQLKPLAIFHPHSPSGLFGTQGYLIRPIMQCWVGDQVDLALGVGATTTNNVTGETLSHWYWPLSWETPAIGMRVGTYAFPNHAVRHDPSGQTVTFRPDAYMGSLLEVGDFRDRVMVPYPYIHADFRIHGGSSGGPIFGEQGAVLGANCTELKPDGPGYGAQIRCLQDAFIEDAVLTGESVPRRVTFAELVGAAVVTAAGYMPHAVPPQPGRVVRLDQVPITAAGPALEIVEYF